VSLTTAEVGDDRLRLVLDLIRSGAAASRADVARLTGISRSTASARVDPLIRRGLVREECHASSERSGRPPRRLSLAPGLGTVLAITVGHAETRVRLADATGTVLDAATISLPLVAGHAALLDAVTAWLGVRRGGTPPLLAACIGVPGPVGPGRDAVVDAAHMRGWSGLEVRRLATLRLGVPVAVENDANLLALGEHTRQGGDGGELVVIKIAEGIGCGVVLDGKLYRGAGGIAGDIGHVTVPDAPPLPCPCGRTGCLEVVATQSALLGRLHDAGVDVADMRAMSRRAREGHPLAADLLHRAGRQVGRALATVIGFVNPSTVMLAGDICLDDAFAAAVTSTIRSACLSATTAALTITLSDGVEDSELRGATLLALDAAFAAPR
jgi:predicted NBD/HSP70 family sugar kinase